MRSPKEGSAGPPRSRSASPFGPPLGAGDAPSRAPVPHSRCTLPKARPAGRRDAGVGRPPGPGPPCRATGGDWCRQGVRHPRSARSGSRDRGAGAGAGPSEPRLRLQRHKAAPGGGSAAPSPGSRRGARARRPQPTGCRQTRARRCAAPAAPTWPPAGRRKRRLLPLPVLSRGPRSRPRSRRVFGHAPAYRTAPHRPRGVHGNGGTGRPRADRGRRRRKRRGRKRRRHQVTGSVSGR